MIKVKILAADGTGFDAMLDVIPRSGDRVILKPGMMAPEQSFKVTQVDFHLSGPALTQELVVINVS